MTQTDKQAQCSAQAYHDGGGGGWYACSRNAKLERNGKPYCTQHDPQRVTKRRAEQHAKYEAESERRREYLRREAAEKRACADLSTEALEAGVVADLLAACEKADQMVGLAYHTDAARQVKAAIVKAKGGKP